MIYSNIYDENGNERTNCTVIFITLNSEEEITSITNGGKVTGVSSTGLTFVVEHLVAEQIDKFEVIGRNLVLKDGEELIPPVKTERELQREELLRQIAELDAAEDEPVDIEEQTDAPLLDYTEQPSE